MPAMAARTGPSAATPVAAGAASPTLAPTAQASTSRTALPTALLGGARAVSPATELAEGASATGGGLADGIAIPPPVATSPNANVPQMGTFTPAKSKYYPGQVVDPLSGTHYDSESGRPNVQPPAPPKPAETPKKTSKRDGSEIEFIWDKTPHTMLNVVMRYIAYFGVLMLVGMGATFFIPATFVPALLLVNFIGAMMLPVLGVVPWQDEDSDDVFLMIVLTLVFGPVVSLVIYSVLTAMRQDGNPAILGILAVAMLARVGIGVAAGNVTSWWDLTPFPLTGFTPQMMLINWVGFVALAGWYFANVFHKLDE